MEAFEVVRRLGQGAFGEVTECLERGSGDRVAIKEIANRRYDTWEECLKLREVRALRQMGGSHPNIVVLRQVIRENRKLFLVFDFHPGTLHRRLRQLAAENANKVGPHARVPLAKVALWGAQLLSAVAHMHRYGFFHRDIKPENLLLDAGDNIQVCDFGLARDVRSRPPYTDYVSTKWYRAPELVLRSKVYNSPVDIWACACVLAEVLTLKPLFPAKDTIEHLLYISSCIGPITSKTWPAGFALVAQQGLQLPRQGPTDPVQNLLAERYFDGTFLDRGKGQAEMRSCVAMLQGMLQLDPHERWSALECLQHPFLRPHAVETPVAGKTVSPVSPSAQTEEPLPTEGHNCCRQAEKRTIVRRSSALRILTQEVDELTKEIEGIKTSPRKVVVDEADLAYNWSDEDGEDDEKAQVQEQVQALTGEIDKPVAEEVEASGTSPKRGPRRLSRTDSAERREKVNLYLSALEDDEDDEDDGGGDVMRAMIEREPPSPASPPPPPPPLPPGNATPVHACRWLELDESKDDGPESVTLFCPGDVDGKLEVQTLSGTAPPPRALPTDQDDLDVCSVGSVSPVGAISPQPAAACQRCAPLVDKLRAKIQAQDDELAALRRQLEQRN